MNCVISLKRPVVADHVLSSPAHAISLWAGRGWPPMLAGYLAELKPFVTIATHGRKAPPVAHLRPSLGSACASTISGASCTAHWERVMPYLDAAGWFVMENLASPNALGGGWPALGHPEAPPTYHSVPLGALAVVIVADDAGRFRVASARK